MEVFRNLAEAKVVIQAWRQRYNQERPLSSLGYLTPLEYRAQWEREQNGKAVEAPSSLSLWAPQRCQGKNLNGLSPESGRQADTSSVTDWALRSLSGVALSSQPTRESVP
ncbi:MAG: hypothetical protein GHCLOJNM_00631 [bacterium]|nr:hypothetical protein [bacterium]